MATHTRALSRQFYNVSCVSHVERIDLFDAYVILHFNITHNILYIDIMYYNTL